jgi:hypothetical protein
MDLIVFIDLTIFHPVGDPVRPQGCERPAGGRVDELFPGGLGMVDCLLHVLPLDPSIIHKTLNFLRDMQTYLVMGIHRYLGTATDLPGQSFLEVIPVFVTVENACRSQRLLSDSSRRSLNEVRMAFDYLLLRGATVSTIA